MKRSEITGALSVVRDSVAVAQFMVDSPYATLQTETSIKRVDSLPALYQREPTASTVVVRSLSGFDGVQSRKAAVTFDAHSGTTHRYDLSHHGYYVRTEPETEQRVSFGFPESPLHDRFFHLLEEQQEQGTPKRAREINRAFLELLDEPTHLQTDRRIIVPEMGTATMQLEVNEVTAEMHENGETDKSTIFSLHILQNGERLVSLKGNPDDPDCLEEGITSSPCVSKEEEVSMIHDATKRLSEIYDLKK